MLYSEIYFSTISHPFPTDPWKQLGAQKCYQTIPQMRKFLKAYLFLCNHCDACVKENENDAVMEEVHRNGYVMVFLS